METTDKKARREQQKAAVTQGLGNGLARAGGWRESGLA